MARITFAGESLIAQKQGAKEVLQITRFIYANVPGLDPNTPVDRAATKPPASQIVHSYDIPAGNSGYVNPNQVVYSSMLGSDIGDFDWNWMGLESAEGVLFAVAYLPLQQKRRNIPPLQIGNNVTRNILVEYSGAQELTGITIDASTWQHDFTVRLKGIDERERLSNRDVYGNACFFGSGLQLEKVESGHQLKPGVAYVAGIRIEQNTVSPVVVPSIPNTAWLDVALERQLNDAVGVFKVVFGSALSDYTDSAGTRHFLTPLASLPSSTVITDLRAMEPISSSLVKHFAAQNGDYPKLRARATTKADVGLDQIPNAISVDQLNDSPNVLATTRMVQGVRARLDTAITALVDGTTAVGRALKLASARTFRITGAATGSTTFDGSADAEIALTLVNSGVSPGTYTKVNVNAKGLITGASNPTTLSESGITDVYTKAESHGNFVKQGGGVGQLGNAVKVGWSGTGLKVTVDNTDLGNVWYSANFDPNSKANVADVYNKGATDNLLKQKVSSDYLVYAGFAGGVTSSPYFRHSNGSVYYLQPALNFSPVEQGSGAHQQSNKVRIGWSSLGHGLRYQVDSSDLGLLWSETNFYRPDSNNFFPIAVASASVQFPAGGTWCYSVMAYYLDGRGVGGRSGIAAGGTVLSFGNAGSIYGFAWRFAP